MINVISKKCIKCNKKKPNFNFEYKKEPEYCSECKEPTMLNVNIKKCIKCKIRKPLYNYEGEKIATHCKNCKYINMIDIKNKKCIICKIKIPYYNYERERNSIYCNNCKDTNILDIKNKKCIICKIKIPNYNYQTQKVATHCKKCKEYNMININHKKCDYENCNTTVYYGFCCQLKSRCAKHKISNKMYINPIRNCETKDCKKISTHGKTEPMYCFNHSKEDDICLICKTCNSCGREHQILDNNDLCLEYCSKVDIDIYIKRIIKNKDIIVLEYLNNNIDYKYKVEYITLSNNIDYNCNKPLTINEFENHIAIVEIEEQKLKTYNCTLKEYEISRMYEIGINIFKTKNKNTIFIRFNPNSYISDGKVQKYTIPNRLDLLVKWIKYFIHDYKPKTHNNNIKYIKLFYDDFKDGNVKIENIDRITNDIYSL